MRTPSFILRPYNIAIHPRHIMATFTDTPPRSTMAPILRLPEEHMNDIADSLDGTADLLNLRLAGNK